MKLELNTQEAVALAEKQSKELADNSRIVVNSKPTFEKAKEQLIQLKSIKKFVKEKKESITKPLTEALKNARALFKPIENKVETIEKYLNGQVMAYNNKLIAEQKKREEEAAKKIKEAEKKGEEVNMDKVVRKIENTQERINMIRTRKIKRLVIENVELIPRDYMLPNEQLIKKDLINGKIIPGAKLVEEDIPVNSY